MKWSFIEYCLANHFFLNFICAVLFSVYNSIITCFSMTYSVNGFPHYSHQWFFYNIYYWNPIFNINFDPIPFVFTIKWLIICFLIQNLGKTKDFYILLYHYVNSSAYLNPDINQKFILKLTLSKIEPKF